MIYVCHCKHSVGSQFLLYLLLLLLLGFSLGVAFCLRENAYVPVIKWKFQTNIHTWIRIRKPTLTHTNTLWKWIAYKILCFEWNDLAASYSYTNTHVYMYCTCAHIGVNVCSTAHRNRHQQQLNLGREIWKDTWREWVSAREIETTTNHYCQLWIVQMIQGIY